ncbi:MAG TPA: protein translocase subunit SecD [bacterium]|nr:protein translocase subunit SecD [bacterium]
MPTFQVWKPIVVLVVLIAAVFAVYPSVRWYSLSPEDRINQQSTEEMREVEARIEQMKSENRQDEIPAARSEYDELKAKFGQLRRRAIPLGLDLQGGIHAVLQVEIEQLLEDRRAEAVDRSLEIIRNRIDQLGVLEPVLQRQGANRIIVEVPGITDPTRIIDLLGQTARLEFRMIKEAADVYGHIREIDRKLGVGLSEKVELSEDGGELEVREADQKYVDQVIMRETARAVIPVGYELLWSRPETSSTKGSVYRLYEVKEKAELTGEQLKDARMEIDQARFNEPYVSIELDRRGGQIFRQVTGDNVGKRLAIVLDDRVYSAPVIRERIPHGMARITGRFTIQEARDLGIVLRAGSLPADISVVETRAVGPSLGMDSIRQGIRAGLGGAVVVLGFMIVYYVVAGAIADFAVILNIFVLLGAMALFKTTLTLPGIAGIVLTVGMAVDANVLIYERIREELRVRRDKALAISVEKGYSRAFLTILDANLTTLLTAVMLFAFGTGPIRGFAVTLSLGIVISMFTAIFVTRIIFDFLTNQVNVKELKIGFFQIFGNTRIDFMRIHKLAIGVSLLFILVGLGTMFAKGGLKTNIDFSGGNLVQVRFNEPKETGEIRNVLQSSGYGHADIQRVLDDANEFLVRVKEDARSPEGRDELRARFEKAAKDAFSDKNPTVQLTKGIEQVEPKPGQEARDEYQIALSAPVTEQEIFDAMRNAGFPVADAVPVADQENTYAIKVSQGVTEQLLAVLGKGFGEDAFELRRQEKVGAKVGTELQKKAINAALFSIIGILAYVAWRFQFGFALGAVLALVHDVLVTLGIFAITGREISLSVVAAILTLIGYSLNDTIVVYDRIRENQGLLGGPKDMPTVINNSINQTLSRTILTAATTLFVVIALFMFGGIVLNDFAFALLVGIVVGTYSSIYIASPILIYWQSRR